MINILMAPKIAMHNKSKLSFVNECVCYYCLKIYNTSEIKEWTDKDDTAICPYCGVDAILPINNEEDKNLEVLSKIHKYWF